MAKMCRFYGLKPDDLLAMNTDTYSDLWLAITQLEAQELLVNVTAARSPHFSDKDFKEWHRKHYALAYPDIFEEKKPLSVVDQLRKAMNNLG